jgi:hypothetical protein
VVVMMVVVMMVMIDDATDSAWCNPLFQLLN